MKRSRLLLVSALLAACGGTEAQPAKLPPPPAPTTPPIAPTAQARPTRDKLPVPSRAPTWAPSKPAIFSLSNGLKVYFLEQGPTPLVSLTLVLPRGSATDPKGKSGLSSLTADLLDEGAGGKTALELSEELQRLGTDYGASTDVDNVMLAMNTIAPSFAETARILSDIARRPALDKKEFDRRKDQRIAEALSQESEPSSARAIVLRKALFGDAYGGNTSAGTRTTLKRISHADVKAHYRALIAAEGAALVVVGGIEQEPVKAALEKAFGDWKGTASAKPAALAQGKLEPGLFMIDYPGTSQSSLSLATRAPGEGSSDYFPAMVVSRVFGEAFTSRLNLNLRESKGYTYGARSSFHRWKDAGYFGLSAGVKRETTRASIDESLKELTAICSARPVTAQEREEAVGGLLLGFPGRFERTGDVAAQLATLPLYGRADDWFEKWPGRVQSVTVEAANQTVKGYCDPNAFVIVLAGDRKVVEPTLEGLERKLHIYDAQGNPLGK